MLEQNPISNLQSPTDYTKKPLSVQEEDVPLNALERLAN